MSEYIDLGTTGIKDTGMSIDNYIETLSEIMHSSEPSEKKIKVNNPDLVILPTRDLLIALEETIYESEIFEPNMDLIIDQLIKTITIQEDVYFQIDMYGSKIKALEIFDPLYAEDVAHAMRRAGILLYQILLEAGLYSNGVLQYYLYDNLGYILAFKKLSKNDL